MCLHNFSTVFFKFDVAKATDEIDRRSMSTDGSMPICIVEGNKAKASEVIDRQVYEYTAQCRWSVYEKNEKFAGL
mgnify:CR=1 FL=1|jgi:hypothetical protein